MAVPAPGMGVGQGAVFPPSAARAPPPRPSPHRAVAENSGLFSSTAVGGEIGTSPLEDSLAASGRAGSLHVPSSACAGEKWVHAAAKETGMPPASILCKDPQTSPMSVNKRPTG